MEKNNKYSKIYGLVGRNISYSFSRKYFLNKFINDVLTDHDYRNFDIQEIEDFEDILSINNLAGFNVTIPYKQSIIPYLDKVHKKALKIGAVNTVKITKKGKLVGYNTDEYGFRKSLKPFLKEKHKTALILGTGGASKAVAYALKKIGITYQFVSRSGVLNYENLTEDIIKKHLIIINCTPLGTFPKIEDHPKIPYKGIGNEHILYDLIYNPEETTFLKKGKEKGAAICNGHKMLILQAEKAWEIWND